MRVIGKISDEEAKKIEAEHKEKCEQENKEIKIWNAIRTIIILIAFVAVMILLIKGFGFKESSYFIVGTILLFGLMLLVMRWEYVDENDVSGYPLAYQYWYYTKNWNLLHEYRQTTTLVLDLEDKETHEVIQKHIDFQEKICTRADIEEETLDLNAEKIYFAYSKK